MSFVPILTDLAGVPRSELAGAKDKGLTLPMSSLSTSRINVRLDHPDADFLLGGDALVKWYEIDDDYLLDGSRTLHAHHRLITAEEVGGDEGGSVACTFADPYWVLMRRLTGKSSAGYALGTAGAPVDRGAIISDLVTTTNTLNPSGLRMGAVTASANTYVSGWSYKVIGEGIAELGAALDGPDWRVRPIDYVTTAGMGYIGELDVAPVIGSTKANAVFEYGDGLLNVTGYKRAISNDQLANSVYHVLNGQTDDVRNAADVASQTARGLLESVVSADLNVNDLRDKLLAAHIAVRKNPRQTITFSPAKAIGTRVPRFGRDFVLGDIIPFRASAYTRALTSDAPALTKRINALARVYMVDLAIDEFGVATPTLTTTPQ